MTYTKQKLWSWISPLFSKELIKAKQSSFMTFQNMYTLAQLLIFSHLIFGSSVSLSSLPWVLEVFFLSLHFLQNSQSSFTLNSSRERLLAIKDTKEPSGSYLTVVGDFLGRKMLFLFLFLILTKSSSARIKFHFPTTTSSYKPFKVGGTTAFPSRVPFLPAPLL